MSYFLGLVTAIWSNYRPPKIRPLRFRKGVWLFRFSALSHPQFPNAHLQSGKKKKEERVRAEIKGEFESEKEAFHLRCRSYLQIGQRAFKIDTLT